jgi:hypothetical protein
MAINTKIKVKQQLELITSTETDLRTTPKGRVKYDFINIREGESWFYYGVKSINVRQAAAAETRRSGMPFETRIVSATSCVVTRKAPSTREVSPT